MRQILLSFFFIAAMQLYAGGIYSYELSEGLSTDSRDYGDSIMVEKQLSAFVNMMKEEAKAITSSPDADLSKIENDIKAISLKWDVYYQKWNIVIADDDSCTQRVIDFTMIKEAVTDSLAMRKSMAQGKTDLDETEKFLKSQKKIYDDMKRMALGYSLVENSKPLLDDLKEREKLAFSSIEGKYTHAKEITSDFPPMFAQMKRIEEDYVYLRCASEEIQKAEYKSLWDRVKDYVYGLAAVSMILMFFNMVYAKIKQIKDMREQAKKIKEQLRKSESSDLPTI